MLPLHGYQRPLDTIALAHNFRVFARADCADEPLYAALSNGIAGLPAVLSLAMQAPYPQRRPVLLFAATHDLLLAGQAHPLAQFYRSIVDGRELRVDFDSAVPLFADFCDAHREAVVALLSERAVQTNEVGRCAGLRLALSTLAADEPVALIDVGCSAGLNLLVDRYRYEYRAAGGDSHIEGPASEVAIAATITDGDPFANGPRPLPPIVQRTGIDLAPTDVHDPRDARWLKACVWPSDAERHARLSAALALARKTPLALHRGDADTGLAALLDTIGPGVRPIVFHSWVASYFDHPARRRFADANRAMVVERNGVWISAEGPGVIPGLSPPPVSADASLAIREATIWHVTTRLGGGTATHVLARSHPHCRWIDWIDRR